MKIVPISEAKDDFIIEEATRILGEIAEAWKKANAQTENTVGKVASGEISGTDLAIILGPVWRDAYSKIEDMEYVMAHLKKRIEKCRLSGILDGDPRAIRILRDE